MWRFLDWLFGVNPRITELEHRVAHLEYTVDQLQPQDSGLSPREERFRAAVLKAKAKK